MPTKDGMKLGSVGAYAAEGGRAHYYTEAPRGVDAPVPEFRVTIKVRNNLLLNAMRDAGFQTGAAVARAASIPASILSAYLTLRRTPIGHNGEYRSDVWALSSTLCRDPEELFPESFMTRCLKKNTVDREVYESQVVALMDHSHSPEALMITDDALNSIDAALATLSPRQEVVLRRRFGIGCEPESLEDIAKSFRVTRERTRQIEYKALNTLRSRRLLHSLDVNELSA